MCSAASRLHLDTFNTSVSFVPASLLVRSPLVVAFEAFASWNSWFLPPLQFETFQSLILGHCAIIKRSVAVYVSVPLISHEILRLLTHYWILQARSFELKVVRLGSCPKPRGFARFKQHEKGSKYGRLLNRPLRKIHPLRKYARVATVDTKDGDTKCELLGVIL